MTTPILPLFGAQEPLPQSLSLRSPSSRMQALAISMNFPRSALVDEMKTLHQFLNIHYMHGFERFKEMFRSMKVMAPKVLANQAYKENADIYSYGIILWELLTRQCPYDDVSAIQCALAVLNRNHRSEIPRWCPPAMQMLIRSCLMKNPDERPSFTEILQALDDMP